MPLRHTDLTPEQIYTKDISAMDDSVNLINEIIAGNLVDQESLDTISRNYRHLQIMLERPNILTGSEDLSRFQACINTAEAYVTTNTQS